LDRKAEPALAELAGVGFAERTPYFVMELVRGLPITEFCDRNHLTPRQRLELFLPVCAAVQHAHQKGIIHRDLKPSNILVTLHDGVPVPKVIDFGVAKALGQELTDKTLFTGFAQLIGTPLYMSPEQAGQSGLDVDTRSDIYSLGVLLYELLTGTTPFTRERFRKAAFDEVRRIIREEEPPRPSSRLSTTDELPSIAAHRMTGPVKLGRLVKGDLDCIVMKALEKDRSRRYETATGLAQDLDRHMRGEPIQARRVRALERTTRWFRRNPVIASLLMGILATWLLGTSVSAYYALRAIRSEAIERWDYPAALASMYELAGVYTRQGRPDHARGVFEDALRYRSRRFGPDHPATVLMRNSLAWWLATAPDPAAQDVPRAMELAKGAVDLEREQGGFWNTLGVAQYRSGEWEAAVASLEESDRLLGGEDFGYNGFFLAMAHHRLGDRGVARAYFDRADRWLEVWSTSTDAVPYRKEELKRFRSEAEFALKTHLP
jgi:tetratricopeptide (TPR) repeat protein